MFQFSKKGVPKPSTSKDVADDSDEEEEDDVIEAESDATGKESPEEKTPKKKKPKKPKTSNDSNSEILKKILDRADEVAEDRKNLTAPKSNQELVVQRFTGYVNIQLQQIQPNVWFEFSIECMKLVNNYVQRYRNVGPQRFFPQELHEQNPQSMFQAPMHQCPAKSHSAPPPGAMSYTPLQPASQGYMQPSISQGSLSDVGQAMSYTTSLLE